MILVDNWLTKGIWTEFEEGECMNCQKSRGRDCYMQRHECKNKVIVHMGCKDTYLAEEKTAQRDAENREDCGREND